jgi:hypothetical protein
MSKFINQEIDPEHVWINISKGMMVRAAVLLSIDTGRYNLVKGVYKLEDEAVRSVNEMIRLAKERENIRFYIIEEVKEDNNDVTG